MTFDAAGIVRDVFDEELVDNPHYDDSKQVVVAYYGGTDLSLQLYLVLNGQSEAINTELLERKAAVVKAMGCACPEAIGKIEAMGLDIKDLIQEGTCFLGGSPIRDTEGQMVGVVAVSGQDHRFFDQPASEVIARAIEQALRAA